LTGAPKLLEFGEEVLDQVAFFVYVAIEVTGLAAISLWRNDRSLACCRERLDDPLIGVEGLVGDQLVGLHFRQEMVGTNQIVCLATGQMEADRVAERIGQGMDLGAQPTARSPDRLVLAGFFFSSGTVLMSPHNGAVDHRVFIIGIDREMLKYPLPDPGFRPPAETSVDVFQSPKRSGRSRQGTPVR
jgi:hypothetical protein